MGKVGKPGAPPVSASVWRDLLEEAAAFASSEPWERFGDDELFAVRDPASGLTGYACVLGALGEMYALCVYRGAAGYEIHRRLQAREGDVEPGDILGVQDCLMADFADRGELAKEDLAVLKAAGVKPRGRKSWPMFRSHRPGEPPWFLEEAEARFLTVALRGARHAISLADAGKAEFVDRPGEVFCCVPSPEGGFASGWEPVPVHRPPPGVPAVLDPARLAKARARKLPVAGVWEADAPFFPVSFMGRGRPYYPRQVFIVDRDSRFILESKVDDSGAPPHQAIAEAVLAALEKAPLAPAAVHVKAAEAARLLAPLTRELGIGVAAAPALAAVAEVRSEFEAHFFGGGPRPARRESRAPMEQVLSNVARRLENEEFGSPEEAERHLAGLMDSGELDQPPAPRNPHDVAQDIMYRAWELRSPALRVKAARRALKVSPDCADAYVVLAEETAGSAREGLPLYRQAVAAGERALGTACFEENKGHFWGVVATRPYMRALAGLAHCLWETGEREEALARWEEMLRLNPGDNQGMRDVLIAKLGELGRFGAVRELLARYPDDAGLVFLLMRTLAAFERDPAAGGVRELRDAVAHNAYFAGYLAGERRVPRVVPDSYRMGGDDEAVCAVSLVLPAWKRTEGALDWLASARTRLELPKAGRNEPCPCGSGKKYKKCCAV